MLKYEVTEKSRDKEYGPILTVITAALADDCHNGHEDFSLTCSVYSGGAFIMGGCCHEHIIKLRPDLAIFEALHLSDFQGAPMYAVENGFFHLHDEHHSREDRLRIAAEHLRGTVKEMEILIKIDDKQYFQDQLEEMGFPERWKQHAESGIQLLEKLTGKTFNPHTAGKPTYTPLSAEVKAQIRTREVAGYYSAEAQEERRRAATRRKIDKHLDELRSDAETAIKKLRRELEIRLYWARVLGDLLLADTEHRYEAAFSNPIYYPHTNEACFNWSNCGTPVSRGTYEAFKKIALAERFEPLLGLTVVFKESDKEVDRFKIE